MQTKEKKRALEEVKVYSSAREALDAKHEAARKSLEKVDREELRSLLQITSSPVRT